MVDFFFAKLFKKKFSKIKDNKLKERITKQIKKLDHNPEAGKPMKYSRKGTRELYVSPFRLSYELKSKDIVYILDLYHKDEQ